MRLTIFLISALCGVDAAWLRWTEDSNPSWKPPRETASATLDGASGWTPRPTQAPGVKSEGEAVLELLRRDTFTTTNWTNSETCGWVSGSSSYPWTCGNGASCATNSEHAVACVSGDYQPFYVSCFDFEASQAGSCDSLGSATGCCQSSQNPACVTYIWTGLPVRSMFRCGTSTAVTSILDEPQFVIDASISASRSSESAASASSESAARESSLASEASKSLGASGTGAGATATSDPLKTSPTTSSTTNTTNVGAIVGAVVGSLLGLLLLLLLLYCCCCRRRNKTKKNTYNLSWKKKNNEKTTVYGSRREERSEERKKHGRKGSGEKRQKPRRRDDEAYAPAEREYYSKPYPDPPSAAHLHGGGTTVYAPQYHFHLGGNSDVESRGDSIEK
ncbi:hypothetical protein JX266_004873 [Neoarthrinium moseri]|nr:hypothetical protein JX266_004873 [Neoarthrinium moseri]